MRDELTAAVGPHGITLAPALGVVVIAFTPSQTFEFGEVWQGRGFTHDLLAAVLCA